MALVVAGFHHFQIILGMVLLFLSFLLAWGQLLTQQSKRLILPFATQGLRNQFKSRGPQRKQLQTINSSFFPMLFLRRSRSRHHQDSAKNRKAWIARDVPLRSGSRTPFHSL
jgi:hypothetical protein